MRMYTTFLGVVATTGFLISSAMAVSPFQTGDEGRPFPVWDQRLESNDGDIAGCGSSRFECIWDGVAVRDSETGLVWELVPQRRQEKWLEAQNKCLNLQKGGQFGWRLPSVVELRSLHVTPVQTNGTFDALLEGHPFRGLSNDAYWTTTLVPNQTAQAYAVRWISGSNPSTVGRRFTTTGDTAEIWCARGGAFK